MFSRVPSADVFDPGSFPGYVSRDIFRDGFKYNLRDVPQTRFPVTFLGSVFGGVSRHVVFGSVSRDGSRSCVSCAVSGTFFRHVVPETFCQSHFCGRVAGRFRIRLQMPFPEPFPQRHFPGTFVGGVSSVTFLPLWRGLLDV